jgi:hypothetical protein
MTAEKLVSLDDLDLVSECSDSYEFELQDAKGKDTGIFISVVGSHAEKVRSWQFKRTNEIRTRMAIAKRKGKENDITLAEDDAELGAESMAIRVTGWRGIKEECNFQNAVKLCYRNPVFAEQIFRESENLANFTKSK